MVGVHSTRVSSSRMKIDMDRPLKSQASHPLSIESQSSVTHEAE